MTGGRGNGKGALNEFKPFRKPVSLQCLEASSTNKHSGLASAMCDYGTLTKARAAQFAALLLQERRALTNFEG